MHVAGGQYYARNGVNYASAKRGPAAESSREVAYFASAGAGSYALIMALLKILNGGIVKVTGTTIWVFVLGAGVAGLAALCSCFLIDFDAEENVEVEGAAISAEEIDAEDGATARGGGTWHRALSVVHLHLEDMRMVLLWPMNALFGVGASLVTVGQHSFFF
jgi:hypothetical protein